MGANAELDVFTSQAEWSKGEFVGREAALAEREKNTAPQKLATLEVVDALDADASGLRAGVEGRAAGSASSPPAATGTM